MQNDKRNRTQSHTVQNNRQLYFEKTNENIIRIVFFELKL